MSFIRREWTAAAADDWTKEDWITIVLSASAYILLTIGMGLSLLLLPAGFITLGLGLVLTWLMHWVIDPKLKKISAEYEKKQQQYLEELEKKVRWEQDNG